MRALAVALQEERWELASLCLLLGMFRTAMNVPEDAIPGLIDALGELGRVDEP